MKNQEAIADLMLAQTDVFYRPKDDSIDMAIIALEQERSRSAEITQYRYDCEKLMEENERLKKALEQEQKTGHWIELGCVGNDNYDFECSECHHTDTQSKTVKVNYCWYCGAKMEGE